ncbi:hypothetical protein H6761_01600 [Candidatus Nomurabacteria bacterium]|nr:hypothetical protein [Candidatus Nomurabacteria bacterium]
MGNFKRDNRRSGGDRGDRGSRDRGFGGGRRDFGGSRDRGFGGGRDRDRQVEMHNAVCDGCGATCEVPFRPTSGKPIYCNDCFKKSDSRPARDSRGSDRGQGNKQLADALSGLNHKLDQIINLLQAKPKTEVKVEKVESKKEKTTPVEEKTTPKKKTTKKVAAVKKAPKKVAAKKKK